MAQHLYAVGQAVSLKPNSGNFLKISASYVISAQLPPSDDSLQYRIKCTSEPYERVVAEHQLVGLETSAELAAAPVTAPPQAQIWTRRGIQAAPPARVGARSR